MNETPANIIEPISNSANPVQNITPPIDAIPTSTALDGTPKKRNYLPWLLGILGLVIVLVAILFIYFGKSKSTPVPLEQHIIDTTNIDMSSWKTYTNSKHNYQIKYPPSWEHYFREDVNKNETSKYITIKSLDIDQYTNGEPRNAGGYSGGMITLDIYRDMGDSSSEIDPIKEGDETIVFGGQTARKLIGLGGSMIEVGPIKYKGFIYKIQYDKPYGSNDEIIFNQILSTFKFTQTNDSEVIVPNVIQQLIPQVKWELQQSISKYPLLDFGVSVLVSQRTGTIINPDVAGNPYDISDLLSDQSKLTELGWTKDLPKGASSPLTSITDYHKTVNGVDKILRFVSENTDLSSVNPSDSVKIKCPCVNKITVFQQQ